MNQPITYALRRNIAAMDKSGRPEKIAVVLIRFPDGSYNSLAIPEGLIASIPPDKREDFIASEVEAVVGYEVTRQR